MSLILADLLDNLVESETADLELPLSLMQSAFFFIFFINYVIKAFRTSINDTFNRTDGVVTNFVGAGKHGIRAWIKKIICTTKSCLVVFEGHLEVLDLVFAQKTLNEGLAELRHLLGVGAVEVGPDLHSVEKFADCTSFWWYESYSIYCLTIVIILPQEIEH